MNFVKPGSYDYRAVPSPDGRYIALLDLYPGAKDPTLHLIAVDSGQSRTVEVAPRAMGAFIWSPDSTHFAFMSQDPDDLFELNVFSVDESQFTQTALNMPYYTS
jgi:hypothetical protein